MYAIIRTGGKQYKVQPGDTLKVEKLNKELGDEFDVTEVLAVGGEETLLGEPTVANAKVTVVVTNQDRAPKVIVFKKKRRQGYRRMQGHRQLYTELFVKAITDPAGKTAQAESAAKVYDPAKKVEILAAREAEKQAAKQEGRKEVVKKATKKKATAKKKTAKKAAAKKSTAKKKTAKKKAAKKKTATKKKTAKKTTKKKS
ncbi:MAG: 50S ribosomal protein L21 [Bdellovibrionales bacterium]